MITFMTMIAVIGLTEKESIKLINIFFIN